MDVFRHPSRQFIAEAEGYLELGMVDHALESLEQLGKTEALEFRPLHLKGKALRVAGRYAEAVVVLRRTAILAPKNIYVWLALGWCYKRIERVDLAIQSLGEALAIEPGNALIHYNLACYWSLVGNKHQALQYLATAIDIESHYRDFIKKESDLDPIRTDPQFLTLSSAIV